MLAPDRPAEAVVSYEPSGAPIRVKGGCCFCGGTEGRPRLIEPFGYACPSCTDSFFTYRTGVRKSPVTKLSDADVRKALATSLGPPYEGVPVKIDATDTDLGLADRRKVVTAGFLCYEKAAGLGLYVYTGTYRSRVFLKAQAPGDKPRPRLAWHSSEWRQVAREVGYVVFRVHDGDPKSARAFFVITMQRALELSRHYDTPRGRRCGPPIEACTHYDVDWGLVKGPADLETLEELAAL